MGRIEPVELVKPFCGIIAAGDEALRRAQGRLVDLFGEIDCESEITPFDFTDYYRSEMGDGLLRKFVSFRKLVDPLSVVDAKLATNKIEEEMGNRVNGELKRAVNLDPGYVNAAQLVLATTKAFSHRVYLGRGIYAEVTLNFRKGRLYFFEWTYPDFRSGRFYKFFLDARRMAMEQAR